MFLIRSSIKTNGASTCSGGVTSYHSLNSHERERRGRGSLVALSFGTKGTLPSLLDIASFISSHPPQMPDSSCRTAEVWKTIPKGVPDGRFFRRQSNGLLSSTQEVCCADQSTCVPPAACGRCMGVYISERSLRGTHKDQTETDRHML